MCFDECIEYGEVYEKPLNDELYLSEASNKTKDKYEWCSVLFLTSFEVSEQSLKV